MDITIENVTLGSIIGILGGILGVFSFFLGYKREKNIEKLKGQVEKDNHILRIRFETKFNMLKMLSETTSFLVTNISSLIPQEFEIDKIYKIDKNSYFENVIEDYNSFLVNLNAAGAFLSRDMYDEFHNLRKLCEETMLVYEKKEPLKNKDDFNIFVKNHDKISNKWIYDIMPKIRNYIRNYFKDESKS